MMIECITRCEEFEGRDSEGSECKQDWRRAISLRLYELPKRNRAPTIGDSSENGAWDGQIGAKQKSAWDDYRAEHWKWI